MRLSTEVGIQIAWVLLSQMSTWPPAIHMLRPIVKAGRLRLASVLDDGSGSWRKSVDPMKSTQGFDIFLYLMNHPSAWDAEKQSVQTILFLPNACCKDRVVSIRRTARYLAQYSVVFHRFMHPVLLAICDSTTDREVLWAVHPSVSGSRAQLGQMGHSLSGCPTGMEDAKLGTRLGSLKQLLLGISVLKGHD